VEKNSEFVSLQQLYPTCLRSEICIVNVKVTGIPEGQYLDTGVNNGRQVCNATEEPVVSNSGSSEAPPPATEFAVMTSLVLGGDGKCTEDGLYADPTDCRGFVKCAQV
jgi:hypothetical protein